MTFGTFWQMLRMRAKIEVRDLSKMLDISKTLIWRIERGERLPPKREVILRLGRQLNLNEEEYRTLAQLALKARMEKLFQNFETSLEEFHR